MNYFIHNGTDPYFNMALDSYLLENTEFEGFWLWQNRPSVIVGLNQSVYAEVNLPYLQSHDISLVRRVSGGGAVYHDLGNLNYSFIGHDDGPSIITSVLKEEGVPAELTGRNDIKVDGRKCSGYAKRMAKGRTLVHGTLMFDVNLEVLTQALAVPGSKLSSAGVESVRSRVANLSSFLPYASIGDFADAIRSRIGTCEVKPDFTDQVEKLAGEKFRRWEWIYGRSPKTDFSVTRRLPCGSVTTHYSLKRGRISEIAFTGDFIGSKPVTELEQRLLGATIEEAAGIDTRCYFDSVEKLSELL